MTDDLVKRLREVKDWWREPGRTAEQAADRIEALEAALRYVDANMVGNDHGDWEMLPDFRYGVIHAALGEKKDD